jgi:hypothetical protein
MSDEQMTKRGPSRPPKATVTPRDDESTWGAEDVIQKRLAGAPFGVRAEAIPLKEPGKWHLYIANSLGDEGRHYDMVHRKGWIPCTIDDLADGVTAEAIGLRVAEDGRALVRGARGDERVYKMDKALYNRVQHAKAESNVKGMRSESAARTEAAEAAVAQHGAEAAEFIATHTRMSIKDSQQRIA